MTIKNVKKLRQKIFLIYGFILLCISIVYLILFIQLKQYSKFIHIISLSVIFIIFCLIGFEYHKIKKSLIQKHVKIVHNQFLIPFPQKFSNSMVDFGRFFRNYRYKRHVIPDYLIEFREGNILYLYRMAYDISDENYTIIRTGRFDIALVKDAQNKKRILHLGNVEFVD